MNSLANIKTIAKRELGAYFSDLLRLAALRPSVSPIVACV